MVSPSSSSSKRSTPCVEGCCGPMLSVMRRDRAVVSAASAGASASVTITPGVSPSVMESDSGTCHRVVFPQRVAFPIFRHHDATEVRMVPKSDAEQVEHLALIPIGGAPNRSHRIDFRLIAGQGAFQSYPLVALHRVQ